MRLPCFNTLPDLMQGLQCGRQLARCNCNSFHIQAPFPLKGKLYFPSHQKFWHRALAGMAQRIECRPANRRVAGSIPSQGTRLDCGPGPQWGLSRGNHTLMFLSLSSPPFPSVFKKNFFGTENSTPRGLWTVKTHHLTAALP